MKKGTLALISTIAQSYKSLKVKDFSSYIALMSYDGDCFVI